MMGVQKLDQTRSKILGCIAASRIGSSMAMPTEHMSIEQIESTYGAIEDLQAVEQTAAEFRWPFGPRTLKKNYSFCAGSTEDGIERQKLIADAIIRKQGRINIEDFADSWKRNITEEKFGYSLHYSDKQFFDMLVAGVHPKYIGLMSLWPQIVTFARSCHPIGLINAGDPNQAADDVYNVGAIYHQSHGTGLQTAAAYAAGLAKAMEPGATVDGVVSVVLSHLDRFVKEEFEEVLELADVNGDYKSVRRKINDFYIAKYGDFKSTGEEIVARGLAIFVHSEGDVVKSIVGGVNFARDTDCTAAISAGLAGALSGADAIPREWLEATDAATKANARITVCTRSLDETTDGIHDALRADLTAKRRQADQFLN